MSDSPKHPQETQAPDLFWPLEAPDAIREKLVDALIAGYQAEFDPEEAERAGAFLEDAVSEQDALDSTQDQDLTQVLPWGVSHMPRQPGEG